MARSADEKGDWEKRAMESFGQYGSLSFLESHLSQFGLHFLGTLFVIGYFAWSLTWHKMPRKKFPESRLQVSQLVALPAVLSSQRIQKIQPSQSFRFIVCYFSPVEVVEVALLFAR